MQLNSKLETEYDSQMNAGINSGATEATPLVESPELSNTASSATVYLCAGATSVAGASVLATNYFLKDSFSLGPASIAFYTSFGSIGWVLKPLWGFITDTYPIFGERRRPYLAMVACIGAVSFSAYGLVSSVWEFVAVLVLAHCCMSFLTALAQAILVERSGREALQVASFNFSSFFGLKIGVAAIIAMAAGVMLDRMRARTVLMLCSVAFVPVLLPLPWMCERDDKVSRSVKDQVVTIMGIFHLPEVWGTTLYIFVFCAMPNASSAMFFFNVDVLGFSPTFLAFVGVVGSLAQVLGLALYHWYLTKLPFRPLFASATILCAIVSATPLIQVFRLNRAWGIDDHVFALVDTFVISLVAEILWIPMLVLASRLCPVSVEGTTFALFLAIHNFGFWVSGVLSAGLMKWLGINEKDLSNLWVLLVMCCVCMFVPLALLPVVPKADPESLREERKGTNSA